MYNTGKLYLSGDTEMRQRDKDTRKYKETKDEVEDEDEQKSLNREKGLIDHRINQGCSNAVQKRPIIFIV